MAFVLGSETLKEVATKRYSPNPDLLSVSLDAHCITGIDAEEDEGKEAKGHNTHPARVSLFEKKWNSGEKRRKCGKKTP